MDYESCSDYDGDVETVIVEAPEEELVANSYSSAEEPCVVQPVKRKVPIIRKPGEIVTPMHIPIKTKMNVSASSSLNNQTLTPRPRIKTKIKTEWKKVEAISKTSLTTETFTDCKSKVQKEMKLKPKREFRKTSMCEVVNEIKNKSNDDTVDKKGTQLDRIERKMDEILNRLERQETALSLMKKNIFDIKSAITSSVIELDENGEPPAKSAKRKCLVVFPVSDDDYLLRLEELVSSDEDIMEDVISLYKTAPVNSAYDFLRYNINALFKNCSKYTWTGKPPNSCPTALPSKAAGSLCLIDHLIRCAAETFPHVNRDLIHKDLRRALANFNECWEVDTRKCKHLLSSSVLLLALWTDSLVPLFSTDRI